MTNEDKNKFKSLIESQSYQDLHKEYVKFIENLPVMLTKIAETMNSKDPVNITGDADTLTKVVSLLGLADYFEINKNRMTISYAPTPLLVAITNYVELKKTESDLKDQIRRMGDLITDVKEVK